MTQTRSIKLSSIGLALGALALLVVIVHFWVAAAAPSPALEDVVADKVVAIRDATINRLAGRAPEPKVRAWDQERLVIAATSLFGGLAIVLAVLGFVRKEPKRPCMAAAALGAAVIAFPYVVGAIGTLIVIIALGAVLSMFLG